MLFNLLLLFLPFYALIALHKNGANAAVIDIQDCSDQEQAVIRRKLLITRLLLQKASDRLADFEVYLHKPSWNGDTSALSDTLVSTLLTVTAYIDGGVTATLKKPFSERTTLIAHVRFLEDLARTISRNITPKPWTADSDPRIGSSKRAIQFYCGDEWLQPTGPPLDALKDNRPRGVIGDSSNYPRVVIKGLETRPFSDDPERDGQAVAFTINDLSGPYESVVALNPVWFEKFWTGLDPMEPDLGLLFIPGSTPVFKHRESLEALVKNNLESTLIHELSLAVTTAQNDKAYYSLGTDYNWDYINRQRHLRAHPLESTRGCDASEGQSSPCALKLAKMDPSQAVASALNFMYLVMALGVYEFDWSSGYIRELSEARLRYPSTDQREPSSRSGRIDSSQNVTEGIVDPQDPDPQKSDVDAATRSELQQLYSNEAAQQTDQSASNQPGQLISDDPLLQPPDSFDEPAPALPPESVHESPYMLQLDSSQIDKGQLSSHGLQDIPSSSQGNTAPGQNQSHSEDTLEGLDRSTFPYIIPQNVTHDAGEPPTLDSIENLPASEWSLPESDPALYPFHHDVQPNTDLDEQQRPPNRPSSLGGYSFGASANDVEGTSQHWGYPAQLPDSWEFENPYAPIPEQGQDQSYQTPNAPIYPSQPQIHAPESGQVGPQGNPTGSSDPADMFSLGLSSVPPSRTKRPRLSTSLDTGARTQEPKMGRPRGVSDTRPTARKPASLDNTRGRRRYNSINVRPSSERGPYRRGGIAYPHLYPPNQGEISRYRNVPHPHLYPDLNLHVPPPSRDEGYSGFSPLYKHPHNTPDMPSDTESGTARVHTPQEGLTQPGQTQPQPPQDQGNPGSGTNAWSPMFIEDTPPSHDQQPSENAPQDPGQPLQGFDPWPGIPQRPPIQNSPSAPMQQPEGPRRSQRKRPAQGSTDESRKRRKGNPGEDH